jgi:demethylmenaquinone methyltransferase/2-methoxy-6-polyprenyl-1,4-benzoquinol methylase
MSRALQTPADRQIAAPGSGAMFDRIARRYDLLNRVMSLGLDGRWRRRAIAALALDERDGTRVLDVACGTGDVALEILRREPSVEVIGLDPSERMLERARVKAERRRVDGRLSIEVGVAEDLPFADASFAGVTIAFGLRNVSDRQRSLAEMMRVLEPGGRLAILELTEPRGPRWAALARFHIHHVVPRLGALLSGSREYRYLQESIARFAAPHVIANELREAGAERVFVEPMCFGAVHLFVAFAPAERGGDC